MDIRFPVIRDEKRMERSQSIERHTDTLEDNLSADMLSSEDRHSGGEEQLCSVPSEL